MENIREKHLWHQFLWHQFLTAKTPKLSIVQADPGDNKFIECAVALKADVIITGDRALRQIGSYMGIRIANPQEFLKSL